MSGGGSSAPAQPATTTQIQDIPAWEQGYVTDLLGQAETVAAQPYQQFPGQQVAGFTGDQNQAFSNIENAGNTNQANQAAALGQATQGANSANNIYGAGAGDINAASSYNPLAAVAPYLGAASQYNSAAAAQPGLNAAAGYTAASANAASPQGIQSYMSPYTNDVVNGIQNEANLNWNQNIMPGVNNEFVGSGQYGSGRNAQVLGEAAGNFQTGLSSNISNALQSGYTTAGNQAATEAGILGNAANTSITGANAASNAQGAQVSNLLNQANAAGTSTQQQAGNLLGQGTALGNLAATQGNEQLAAGSTLNNLGAQDASTNLTQNQALQAVGQQQQQLNQTNINTAMQNWQNQTQYPAQETEYLNQIIRGLPAPTATTSSSQTTPAYSISPLTGVGGAGTTALALTGSNGQSVGTATGAKKGGLIKGYATGGQVDGDDDYDSEDSTNPLDAINTPEDNEMDAVADTPLDSINNASTMLSVYGNSDDSPQNVADAQAALGQRTPQQSTPANPLPSTRPTASAANPLGIDMTDLDTPDSKHNSKNPNETPSGTITQSQMQQNQLLALARGLLTPSLSGNPWASLGQGIGNAEDVMEKQQKWNAQQQALQYERDQQNKRLGIEQQSADQRGQHYANIDANRASGGNGGVTQGIIKNLMAENPDLSYEDALALAKGGKNNNDDMNNIRKETLAQNAYKNGIPIKGNPNPGLDDYRKMYGVKTPTAPQVNAPTPAAGKPTQMDIDYLKQNPSMASKFEGRFGAGTASQYLGN